MTLLTKSKYLIGLQCLKYLWMVYHDKDKIPEHSASTESRFKIGHEVGDMAKSIYPNGIDIQTEDFMANIDETQELLKKRVPLFEPGFLADELFSRVDILNPVGNDEWDIIEVKSGTKVKDVNVHDVSFQKYCLEKAGLKIRKCFLMHINNQYVKDGDIDPKQFLIAENITTEVEEIIIGIDERIKNMFDIINSGINPDMIIGKHCRDPYDCPLEGECWGFLPEHNVFSLYRGGKTTLALFEDEVYDLNDIPDDYKLNAKQSIQRECARTGKPYVDKEGIKHFLNTLHYPLYYLDFETHNPAIPIYDGMKPYQRIPFQFSLHVDSGKKVEHYSFLASGKEDPRAEFIQELKKVLGEVGSIVVFNESFEKGVLKELASVYPKYKDWVESVLVRVVDLLLPFRNFHYYNPIQKGSAGLKNVLPALTGKSYDDLEISDGEDASLLFYNITFGEVSDEEKKRVRDGLLKYCGLDTEGMIWIVDALKGLSGK